MEIDLRACRLYVPEKKVMSFKGMAAELLQSASRVEGKVLARVVRKLISFRPACPAAVVFARLIRLIRGLSKFPLKEGRGSVSQAVARGVFQWRDFS